MKSVPGQRTLLASALLPLLLGAGISCRAQTLAPTPPMGWNSWDSYGTTIDEQQFKANAAWMAANLKQFGYEYVTIDEGWFDEAPAPSGSLANGKRSLDAYGRYLPDPTRFPSSRSGAGFAPLAAYVHSLGLKFGIHILQGIPREAVARNLPIEGAPFHAKEAANTSSTCQWNSDNYDLQVGPAGQAYYNSIARLYASWGVDLIKIDCIGSRPYKSDEVRLFHQAVEASGRPMVISLSPGPAPLDQAANLRVYVQQWRISDDVWDLWYSDKPFPQGIDNQFPRAAKWVGQASPGHWPDADMLPVGHLGPSPGWGPPRNTRLTHNEQRTMMTLWCMMRSPLVIGGNLLWMDREPDGWTKSLLTNPAVLALDQHSRNNRSVILTSQLAVWTARPGSGRGYYVAVFNRGDSPQTVKLPFARIGLPQRVYRVRDLWEHTEERVYNSLKVTLPPHASTLLLLTAAAH